ncbi:MAG: hypothetical protein LBS84_03105 [Clostridiales bacterium]|nr:hypothetical protein [Clostridiales bacterium]
MNDWGNTRTRRRSSWLCPHRKIESIPAVESLDDILNVSGLDGIIVGPNDLSFSMGCPNQYNRTEFQEMVAGIIKMAREKGISAGCHSLGGLQIVSQSI